MTTPRALPTEVTDFRVLQLAVAGYLARFKAASRMHAESDLRAYLGWCADRLDPLTASRPQIGPTSGGCRRSAGSSRPPSPAACRSSPASTAPPRRHADDPGTQQGLLLVTDDIEAAREELVERGAPVSEVFHGPAGRFHPEAPSVRLPGRDPEGQSYQSHAVFSDPDGNGWVLQEITQRLPGR